VIRGLAVAIAVVLGAALVGLASLPTGASRADAVVASDGRVAGETRVGDVKVLLVSKGGRLGVVVAYRDDKGWFGVPVEDAPRDATIAWAATPGGGRVPALSTVYGRVAGASVDVRWADGRVSHAATATDGTFVVARRGRVRSSSVVVRATAGAVVSEVHGP
jgi:hypothetical protein